MSARLKWRRVAADIPGMASKPHPDDLVHRTTLRIPYPLLDEIDERHKAAMRSGAVGRAVSRNEYIVHLLTGCLRAGITAPAERAPVSRKRSAR